MPKRSHAHQIATTMRGVLRQIWNEWHSQQSYLEGSAGTGQSVRGSRLLLSRLRCVRRSAGQGNVHRIPVLAFQWWATVGANRTRLGNSGSCNCQPGATRSFGACGNVRWRGRLDCSQCVNGRVGRGCRLLLRQQRCIARDGAVG